MAVVQSDRRTLTDHGVDGRGALAREELDAWTCEVVRWHFDPHTGCPFWLEYARQLDWDPRLEIQGFDDLGRFSRIPEEWLCGGPVRQWVPRAFADAPFCAFYTAGTAGLPKTRIDIDDFRADCAAISETMSDEGFPIGADWLLLGAAIPGRLRVAVEHLAQRRGGVCFGAEWDAAWAARLSRRGQFDLLEDYQEHVLRRALTILKLQDDVHCLFTTPRLLEALCEKISLRKAGIRGVLCGGEEVTRQFHRFAREELLEGAEFVPVYGNTLMGLACPKPLDPADDDMVIYHAPQPRAVIQVVDPRRPDRLVEYGERGRIKLTTLTKEFFLPGLLEQDEAIRTPPIPLYPWDGAGDVRPWREAGPDALEEGC